MLTILKMKTEEFKNHRFIRSLQNYIPFAMSFWKKEIQRHPRMWLEKEKCFNSLFR